MLLNFWELLLKICIFLLPRCYPINSVFHVFVEAFFPLTIRVPMVTKLFRLVACYEELSPINIMISQRIGFDESRDKKNIFQPAEDPSTHTRQGADVV